MYSGISNAERREGIPQSEAELPGYFFFFLPGFWLEGKEEMDSRMTTGLLICET